MVTASPWRPLSDPFPPARASPCSGPDAFPSKTIFIPTSTQRPWGLLPPRPQSCPPPLPPARISTEGWAQGSLRAAVLLFPPPWDKGATPSLWRQRGPKQPHGQGPHRAPEAGPCEGRLAGSGQTRTQSPLSGLGSWGSGWAAAYSLSSGGLGSSPRPAPSRAGEARGRSRTLGEPPGQQAVPRGQEEGQAGQLLLVLTGPICWPARLPSRGGLSEHGGIPGVRPRRGAPWPLGRRGEPASPEGRELLLSWRRGKGSGSARVRVCPAVPPEVLALALCWAGLTADPWPGPGLTLGPGAQCRCTVTRGCGHTVLHRQGHQSLLYQLGGGR